MESICYLYFSFSELPPPPSQKKVSESELSPSYSPSPPSKSSRVSENRSDVRRSLPTPPRVGREINRPNTAADFRMRRLEIVIFVYFFLVYYGMTKKDKRLLFHRSADLFCYYISAGQTN